MLDKIILSKREEIEYLKKLYPVEMLLKALPDRSRYKNRFVYSLMKSIESGKPGLIAEIKFQSPSKGVIRKSGIPEDIAKVYEESRYVDCISVLTEGRYFGGHISYVLRVKTVSAKPILRKDFIIDEYQIYESAFFGADAILLIASCLSKEDIKRFLNLAYELSLDVLVELYDESDIEKIEGLNIEMLGINSRNLKTLDISLDHQRKIVENLGYKPKVLIAESGIKTQKDIVNSIKSGFNAFLIGETFMSAEDIGGKISELMEGVKIL